MTKSFTKYTRQKSHNTPYKAHSSYKTYKNNTPYKTHTLRKRKSRKGSIALPGIPGMHTRPFDYEQLEKETKRKVPEMVRPNVRRQEQNEIEGLLAIRKKYPKLPEEVIWKIYEDYVKRNAFSRS